MTNSGFPRPYPKTIGPARRERKMEVLALGLSRTGTMSLYTALQKLGYGCYHMAECSLDSANDSLVLWHQAIEAKYNNKGKKFEGKDFDKMLWRYNAVTDIPCAMFVDELLDAYPDAKIIITSRPVGGWVKSIERSFYEILSWKRWPLLQIVDRQHMHHYIPVLKSALSSWTGSAWDDKGGLPEGFEAHYKHLRQVTKARNREVLEFEAKDGWVPLCGFLQKEIPEEPYPHVNEGSQTADLHYFIYWIRWLIVILTALKYAAPVGIAGGAWWYFQQK